MAYVLCDPNKENTPGAELRLAVDDSAKSKFAVDCYKVFEITTEEFDQIRKNKKMVQWSGDTYTLINTFDLSNSDIPSQTYANADEVTEFLNEEIKGKESWIAGHPKSNDLATCQSFIDSIKVLTFDDLTYPHPRGIEDVIEEKGITYLSVLQLK
tara:strand:+ start:1179 stop:1643 length:465 start_codon:yes stop_codon:yes gene_type:complete